MLVVEPIAHSIGAMQRAGTLRHPHVAEFFHLNPASACQDRAQSAVGYKDVGGLRSVGASR